MFEFNIKIKDVIYSLLVLLNIICDKPAKSRIQNKRYQEAYYEAKNKRR